MPDVHARRSCVVCVVQTSRTPHNIVGNLAAAVMYNINVNRIAHLGIDAGGINLQHPLVLATCFTA